MDLQGVVVDAMAVVLREENEECLLRIYRVLFTR